MINGIRLKVCGLTSLVDAEAADSVGADALGFIFYPKSPRAITLTQYAAMKDRLPPRKRVAVCVEPTAAELAALVGQGFDHYQIHFGVETPLPTLTAWSALTGRAALWLAPKLPPGQEINPAWLALADTLLIDTFHADKYGGTGQTGDWAKFKQRREAHPQKTWILSGGLNPGNVAAAVTATGARYLDVNSGVEQSPGIKDPAKLKALALALHTVPAPANSTHHQPPSGK